MDLTADQVFIVGLVASGLSIGIQLLAAKFGFNLSKFGMTIVVSVVSILLAVLFNLPTLPVYDGDPMAFLGGWVALISAYLGMATAIYNLILSKVLDKINLTKAKFLPG